MGNPLLTHLLCSAGPSSTVPLSSSAFVASASHPLLVRVHDMRRRYGFPPGVLGALTTLFLGIQQVSRLDAATVCRNELLLSAFLSTDSESGTRLGGGGHGLYPGSQSSSRAIGEGREFQVG